MPDITIDGTSVSGITIDGTQVTEVTIDGNTAWSANFYTENFENTTAGNLPSDWSQDTSNTNGYFEVSGNRSQSNAQSLRGYEPDTGSGSTIHTGTSSFSPSGDYEVTFYYNFDRDIIDNSYSHISIRNSDHYNNVSIETWILQFDHGGTQDLKAQDGDGSGGGTMKTLISNFNTDYWYEFKVRCYFGTNSWEVDIDGTTYGPFGFVDNCSPADVPYFRTVNGNCEGYLDNISAKSI